jgi:hypothetical protein
MVRRQSTAIEHFGEQIRPGKYGHRLTRELYAIPSKKPTDRFTVDQVPAATWAIRASFFEDADQTVYNDEYCRKHQEQALANFDLNMEFFARLEPEAFESALNELLQKHAKLKPVTDLGTVDGVTGLYVMVLDGYKQAYVGQSSNIRARLKSHWSGTKEFDRLLWGRWDESVLSIDSFRALDTTRVFAAQTVDADALETQIVASFPGDYLLNRVHGGKPFGFRSAFLLAEAKRRQMHLPGDA